MKALVSLIQLLAAAAALAWIPGAVLYRIPLGNRDARYGLPLEERIFWQVIVSIASALGITLALAAFGRFELRWLLTGQLLLTALPMVVWRGRLRSGSGSRAHLSAVLPVALVAAASGVFLPPSEYIIAGKDPGTYVGEGVQIAQTGALVTRDPVIASVPAGFRDLFFPSHERDEYYGLRFMGFFVQDPGEGTVIGQFPHLFPAALAVGYSLDGLTGVRLTTPVMATLGVLAVYFAGVHIFGRGPAFAAALLLLINVVQVWFARYPNAEVVMQLLVFAAVAAILHRQSSGDSWFGVLGAVLLGLLLFLRFDAVLSVGAIVAALLLEALAGRRFPRGFTAVLAASAATAAIYTLGPMRAYAAYPVAFIFNMPLWQHAALGAAVLALLVTVRFASRSASFRTAVLRWTPVIVAVAGCAAALYALYLREPAGRLAAHDAYALRTFASFYVTAPAVLAAILGFAIFVRSAFWRAPVFYLVTATFAFFFFYKIRIVPEHFWAARRFLPVILPATLLLASAAAVGGRAGAWWIRWPRIALGVTFLVLLGATYLRTSAPVRAHVEYEGLIPKLESLAGRFGDADLVLVESRDAGSDTHVFGMPLAYIYARNVLVLSSARPDKRLLGEFLTWARTQYARVYFVGAGGTDLLSYRYSVDPRFSERFQVPEYESTANAFPRGPRRKEFEYGVYAFGEPAPRSNEPFDLDVGADDNLHVLRFHAAEQTEGRTFRWTGRRSFVSVTSVPVDSRELALVAADGGRPESAPPAHVDVFLDGDRLGSISVDGRFSRYSLPIPPALAARAAQAQDPVELRFETTTWNPAEVLGSGDDRALGIMLDRVTIK